MSIKKLRMSTLGTVPERDIKGITLIALVITIIVLLILAGVSIATLTGENGVLTKASRAKEENNQAAAKEQINLAVMSSFDNNGKFNREKFKEEIEKIGGSIVSEDENTIVVELDGYQATIDAKTGKILNFESAKGVRPQVEVKQQLNGTKVTITVEVTNEVGSVDSIKVTNMNKGTELTGNVNGKIGSFETTLNGSYKVEVVATTDGVTKTTTQIIEVNQIPVEFSMAYGRIDIVWLDTNDQVIGSPNIPQLGDMTPVKWEGTTESTTTSNDTSWYEYKAKTGTEDNLESHWANAKTTDGSYFVWIPRYAYRITYYASESSDQITGYCDGDGIREVNGNIKQALSSSAKTVEANGAKYIVHPAFRNGSSNNFKNGEWDSELSGIWVAKYEASHSDATESSEGSSSTMKIVPGVPSWRSITIGDSYTKAYNYDRSKESHLMKNSEWGAVAYLTQSQYGRNGNEIDINNSSSFITGNGGSPTASSASGVTNAYNTEIGAKASTTGNIYGIYDLSGGAWERTAGYITNGNSSLSSYGSSFAVTTANGEGYKTLSTKYATVYPYDTSSDGNTNNYTSYKNAGYGYGDAILETSTSGSGYTSWFSNCSYFPYSSFPFFVRGGSYDYGANAGVFCFYGNTGDANTYSSFRPVLAF